jgi:signal transduction histidine kinase
MVMSENAQVLKRVQLPMDSPVIPLLDGRALRIARLGWIVLTLLASGILISAFPGYMLKFRGQLAHATPDQLGGAVGIFAAASGIASLVSALLSYSLSFTLFRRKFEEPAATALSFYLMGYAVIMAGPLEFWGTYWLGTSDFALTLQAILMATPTIALFALFPNGRFKPGWMRWVLLASIPWSISLAFLGPMTGSQVEANMMSFTIQAILFSSFILLGIFAQVYRYRRISTLVERQQTRWVLLGLTLWFTWILISTGPYMYLTSLPPGSPVPWWVPASELGWWLSMSILPISLTISIMRFRLWNINIVINRALVFGAVTASTIALYALVLVGLGILFQSSDSIFIPLIATGVAVLTFQPLRGRFQGAINRMMYGERDDPIAVLTRLGEQLEGTATPNATLKGIVETIVHALKLPYAAIVLGDEGEPTVSAGEPTDNSIHLPLIYQGQEVGSLLVGPRSVNEALTPKDQQLLESITRQAGAVAYNARLTADLQQARQHLVNAREEERRRIRRDLHDGLGPQLASLTLKMDATRNLLEVKPKEADRLLSESKAQVQDAVADIRRLVYDLRPPTLDELGLMSTLRERAATFSTGQGHQVHIEGPESLPKLPAAVEVAVYRIVQEALNNAAQHGGAQQCWVRLNIDSGLNLEIEDDGVGLASDYRPGVGITSMRERTAELSGQFQINPRPEGGTLITVWLPLD